MCYPYLLRKGDSLGSKKGNVVNFVPAYADTLTKEQFMKQLNGSFNAGTKEKGPPTDFRELFITCFANYTEYELEDLSGINERRIREIKNEKTKRPKLSYLVALCVAGNVSTIDSLKLLAYAGYVLRNTPEEYLYGKFLDDTRRITVETCNEILIANNFSPLTTLKETTTEKDKNNKVKIS